MSVTFVNSFCMDFNVELFLSNLSVMLVSGKPGKLFKMMSVLVFVSSYVFRFWDRCINVRGCI